MFRYLFALSFFSTSSLGLLAQLPVDKPLDEMETIQLTPESVFSNFTENISLNIFDLPNNEAAITTTKKRKLYAIDINLLKDFFTVPNLNISTKYYPYTRFKITDKITAYITLEEQPNENWRYQAYTFSNDYQYISEVTLAQSSTQNKLSFKSEWNSDNSITINTITNTELSLFNNEKKVLKGELSSKIICNEKGIFSKPETISQKGISINTNSIENKEDLPIEIYLAGNLLKTVQWSDKFAKHFALISYANTKNESSTEVINVPITLFFYHYAQKSTDKKYEIIHQSKMNVKACDATVKEYFASENIFYFNDADNNEVLEAFIPYWMSCRSENVAEMSMQLLLWEGHRDFTQLINIDVKNRKAQYNFNSSWLRLLEPIRKYATDMISYCAENTKL